MNDLIKLALFLCKEMPLNPGKATSCSNNSKPLVQDLPRNINRLGWAPYMSLRSLGSTNKGSAVACSGFHKQGDREKDELLMFFHFTRGTFSSGNCHRAEDLGLAVVRLLPEECSSGAPGCCGHAGAAAAPGGSAPHAESRQPDMALRQRPLPAPKRQSQRKDRRLLNSLSSPST